MKYFIYTRKSTDNEERQVLSIEVQLTELKEFAAKENLKSSFLLPLLVGWWKKSKSNGKMAAQS